MHTTEGSEYQALEGIISRLDTISALLQQNLTLLQRMTGDDPYAIHEPIALILKSSPTGHFLLHRATGAVFDLPIEEKKQSLTGILQELKVVRAPNSKYNPAIATNPDVPESLSHSAFLIAMIANAKGLLAINIGSVGSVASRTLLSIIANATPDQLQGPVRLTFSAGTIEKNAILVEMRDRQLRSISSEGANVGKSGTTKHRLTRSLIDRAFQKLSPDQRDYAIALFDCVHANRDPESITLPTSIDSQLNDDLADDPLLALAEELEAINRPDQLKARLTRARQEFPTLLPQLVSLYNQNMARIGGESA